MYDILAALNAALIPLSAIFLWFFIDYQYKSRNDDQGTPLARFGWSLFFISVGVFAGSCLYFLSDYDFIYNSTKMKLSVIPRGFFVSGLIMGFRALEVQWSRMISIISLCLFLGVLVVRVLW